MSRDTIPLVFVRGERAVCHRVDPAEPAGELARAVALYFAPDPGPSGPPIWLCDEGPMSLDPEIPIGHQVPADARITFGVAPS